MSESIRHHSLYMRHGSLDTRPQRAGPHRPDAPAPRVYRCAQGGCAGVVEGRRARGAGAAVAV